jgi:ribonuclease E
MLESERYNTESDSDGSAGANRSTDVTSSQGASPAPVGQGANVPAGGDSEGQEPDGPGRRLLRRARKAVVRPAGPPVVEAASHAGASQSGHAGAGQPAQSAASEQQADPPAKTPARRRRPASASATAQPPAGQVPAGQPPAAQPPAAQAPAGQGAGQQPERAQPAGPPVGVTPATATPATASPAGVPAPEFTVSAQTAPAAVFQPPVVIFQPPDLSAAHGGTAGGAQDDAAGTGGGATRRRTRSGRGQSASSGQAGDGRPDDEGATGDGSGRAADGGAAAGPASGTGADGAQDGDQELAGSGGRRRRRGGRGHAKAGGAAGDGAGSDEPGAAAGATGGAQRHAAEAGEPASEAGADSAGGPGEDSGGADTPARRRPRRRRSGSGGDSEQLSSDDPPNTVVHVRAPRSAGDEPAGDVRSIKGSTRLEAKRQRRREGRESGRRRPPIISESEFLARREAVERVMVVRQTGDRTQIAVMEDGVLVEHYVDKASHQSYVGNVYLGKVQNVLPSMEAAFVDIGKGRNAVLYAGEVNFDASGLEGESKRIESALKSGQSILVQATKDPIGHKGARLTSQVSLPGRYLVFVPGASMTGISRKLPDTERTRLKQILKQVMPEHAGVIVRTAAEGAAEEELARDVKRLAAQWEAIERKAKPASAPELLYSEPDLTIRVVRDIFNEDFSRLVIASDSEWDIVDEYIRYVAPHLADRLERWGDDGDVFAAYRIDEQIAKALERKVWLPSGGSLVIDTTEAMTVIDVNTGKFTGQGGNLEQTVTRNNLEAAEEIVRQLRVRDVGGIIVIDFIDMVLESNRDLVLRRLLECLARDRTKHQVAEVTSLGLVQMTRKRVGSGLLEAFSVPCEHCNGRGVLISLEPVEHTPAGAASRGRAGADDRPGSDGRGGRDDRGKDDRGGRDDRGGKRSRDGDARSGDSDEASSGETGRPARRSRAATASAKANAEAIKAEAAHPDAAQADTGQVDAGQADHGAVSRDGERAGGDQAGDDQAAQRPASGGRRRRPAARREQAPPAEEHTGDSSASGGQAGGEPGGGSGGEPGGSGGEPGGGSGGDGGGSGGGSGGDGGRSGGESGDSGGGQPQVTQPAAV